MYRGRILKTLNSGFLVAGLACIVCSIRVPDLMPALREGTFVGGVLLMLAGISGFFAGVMYRRQGREMIETIRQAMLNGKMKYLENRDTELAPLINSMNDLVAFAEQSVTDATLKSKELEIELKVANVERQHAEAILHSISDAVVVTDPFDEIRLANESAAKVFDFDLSRATRMPMDKILRDRTIVNMIREMRQSDGTGGRRIVEHQLKTPAGDRAFKMTLSCVNDPSDTAKGPSGVVAVLHDITREKEVAAMKNDFVSNVSHELRTPLASIKAYVEMLIDGEANDEKTTREFYDVIQNEANRLGRLIDNILNVSRIESGLVKVDKKPQSLIVILKEAIEVIAPQARTRNLKIIEQLTPAIYQTPADKDMLYQAVLNLLSNSVKYTREGGTITVQTEVDEAKRRVITRISDTGVGIPPKDLPYVFDKFYRVQANSRMAKGTGLGLSLVKQIIEGVHGGKISVTSEVGKGSCFSFELSVCD